MQRTTMLALGLLQTLNRFRLYLQEVIVAARDLPNELRYQSNRRRHSIAFLIEYVLSSEEETEIAMLASPKMFSCMATEKAARTSPLASNSSFVFSSHLFSYCHLCPVLHLYELRIPSSLIPPIHEFRARLNRFRLSDMRKADSSFWKMFDGGSLVL
jgi:hypothetical protein